MKHYFYNHTLKHTLLYFATQTIPKGLLIFQIYISRMQQILVHFEETILHQAIDQLKAQFFLKQ